MSSTKNIFLFKTYISNPTRCPQLCRYNHTGTQFFEIRKNRPVTGLMETAREMIRESLPIKCLEAVILGIYLTNGLAAVERFPLSFKSQFQGRCFRHVVLGVFHAGRFGALGLSRRSDLMHKPLQFRSLTDLVLDFQAAYEGYLHAVVRVKVGMAVTHDHTSFETIAWEHLSLNPMRLSPEELRSRLDRHGRDLRTKMRKGILGWPSPCREQPRGKSVSPHRTLSENPSRSSREDISFSPGVKKPLVSIALSQSGRFSRV
uniref:Vasohibin 2 n=1 Tax=Eptatretus burgeri TaxID=7764 RepID=A0A8C4Q6Q8_EPTBU